jgi:hypothetical protein
LEFDEDLEPGSVLFKFKAYDPDQGKNGEIKYEFGYLDEDIKETFELNEWSGKLVLRKAFNFIKKNQWQLSVKATDQSMDSIRKSSICIVNIRVNDVNNHYPELDINFFQIDDQEPALIESKFLVKYEGDSDTSSKSGAKKPVSKQDIVFVSKKLPINTTIGYVLVSDKDSSLNGLIESCEISLYAESAQNNSNGFAKMAKMPLNLVDSSSIDFSRHFYSNDLQLNKEIQHLFNSHLSYFSNNNKNNEKLYLILTGLDFRLEAKQLNNSNSMLIYQLELKSSDKALKNR